MKFAIRAKNVAYRLTETEELIVTYILSHQSEVSEMKIVTLAQLFFTAPNTITRFCRKLGYEGFSELKVELKHELSDKITQNKQLDIIMQNFKMIDDRLEKKVAKIFQKAKSVSFYAKAQTHLITELAVEGFQVFDKKFKLLGYEKEVASRINHDSGEVFFFISISGETAPILELAKAAKAQGHQVLSLTNLSDNTLTTLSDISLHCLTEITFIKGIEITDKTPIAIIIQSLFQTYQEVCNITQ